MLLLSAVSSPFSFPLGQKQSKAGARFIEKSACIKALLCRSCGRLLILEAANSRSSSSFAN